MLKNVNPINITLLIQIFLLSCTGDEFKISMRQMLFTSLMLLEKIYLQKISKWISLIKDTYTN